MTRLLCGLMALSVAGCANTEDNAERFSATQAEQSSLILKVETPRYRSIRNYIRDIRCRDTGFENHRWRNVWQDVGLCLDKKVIRAVLPLQPDVHARSLQALKESSKLSGAN